MRIILGIESSCDETAVALVREDGAILAHQLATQTTEHAPFGGVVPEIAARAHLEHLDRLYAAAMAEAGLTIHEVDAIAVTSGPGLIGGVIVGVMFAKALAAAAHKPLIGVNHLEGHALTVRLTHKVAFPYFLLLVSGGHGQMLIVHEVGRYTLLGQTKDDALGEAFDKTAKMLGLGYPGGAMIEQAALRGTPRFPLPKPMMGTAGCDLSFSGLKTAVRLLVEAQVAETGRLTPALVDDIAASFQATVLTVMRERVAAGLAMARAVEPNLTALAVAGGVAANQALRGALEGIAAEAEIPLVVAPPALCTDNGVMIAWVGMEKFLRGEVDDLTLEPRARWPLAERAV